MDDNWSQVFAEEAGSSASLAELIEEACQCRENSDSESETLDEVHSPAPDSPRVWWVDRLRQVFADAGIKWPRPLRTPLPVVSACTGCSAEAAVLKAGCSVRIVTCHKKPVKPSPTRSLCAGAGHSFQFDGGLRCLP